jgi:hypothetical protein
MNWEQFTSLSEGVQIAATISGAVVIIVAIVAIIFVIRSI